MSDEKMEADKITLIVEKGDKKFVLECPSNSTLGDLYDAIAEYKNYILGRMQEVPQSQEVQDKEKDVE